MRKKVLVVLADGFEEVEAITPIDVLRRAGLEVIVAGVGKKEITSSHRLRVTADVILDTYEEIPDVIVLPGGTPGSDNLAKSKPLSALIQKMHAAHKTIAAICAAPAVVLVPTGILKGRKATCYPGFELRFGKDTEFVSERVVTDGTLTTSRGPGTAMEFAFELVRQLVGEETARELGRKMLVPSGS